MDGKDRGKPPIKPASGSGVPRGGELTKEEKKELAKTMKSAGLL